MSGAFYAPRPVALADPLLSADPAPLSRGGDREADSAPRRITIVRLNSDPRSKTYLPSRIAEGKTKPEAIRCLKRYVAEKSLER